MKLQTEHTNNTILLSFNLCVFQYSTLCTKGDGYVRKMGGDKDRVGNRKNTVFITEYLCNIGWLVFNSCNIVSNEGNIFLYPPKKSHPILLSLLLI